MNTDNRKKIEAVRRWVNNAASVIINPLLKLTLGKELAKRIAIKYEVGSGASCTNGKELIVGIKEQEALIYNKSDLLRILKFKAFHEVSHCLWSNDRDPVDNMEYYEKGFRIMEKVLIEEADKLNLKFIPRVLEILMANLMNSICDGRVENLLCNMYPGLTESRDWYRLVQWNNEAIKAEAPKLFDLQNAIHKIATMGVLPKGFGVKYPSSGNFYNKVVGLSEPLGKYVTSNTIYEGYPYLEDIARVVAPYYIEEYALTEEEYEKVMSNLEKPKYSEEELRKIAEQVAEQERNRKNMPQISNDAAPAPQNGPIVSVLKDNEDGKPDSEDEELEPDVIVDLRKNPINNSDDNNNENEPYYYRPDDMEKPESNTNNKGNNDSSGQQSEDKVSSDDKSQENEEDFTITENDDNNKESPSNDQQESSEESSFASKDEDEEDENDYSSSSSSSSDESFDEDEEDENDYSSSSSSSSDESFDEDEEDENDYSSSSSSSSDESFDEDEKEEYDYSSSSSSSSDESFNEDEEEENDDFVSPFEIIGLGSESMDADGIDTESINVQNMDTENGVENEISANNQGYRLPDPSQLESLIKTSLDEIIENTGKEINSEIQRLKKAEAEWEKNAENDNPLPLDREAVRSLASEFGGYTDNVDVMDYRANSRYNTKCPTDILTKARRLANKLKSIIYTKSIKDRENCLYGEVDSQNLSKFISGQPDFYRQEGRKKETELACLMLKDDSGSMSGDNEKKALEVLSELEETFKIIGFPLRMQAFSTRSGETMKLIKSWEDTDNNKSYTYSFHRQSNPGGGNNDAYSIALATDVLAKRREKAKLLIVVSDGAPCCSTELVKKAVDRARGKGIFVISILIGTEYDVKNNWDIFVSMYGKNLLAGSLDRMGDQMFRFIKKFISKI